MSEQLEKTTIPSENIEKIVDNAWFKNSGKIIAILTTVCTIAVFLVRGYWYIYEWGYFYTIGIDRIYIDVESMGVLYYVLGYLGIAGIMVASNYLFYSLCVHKRKRFIPVWALIETIVFWIIIFLSSNLKLLEVLDEIIKQGNGIDYLILTCKMMLSIMSLNIAGMYYGLVGGIGKVKTKTVKSIDLKVIRQKIIELLLIIAIEGIVFFLIGMDAGYEKRDYKLIVETLENVEAVEDKYIFELDSKDVRIYPILYEDKENFIISYLCSNENGIYIESMHQMMIAKENVETIYCENIFEIGKTVSKSNDDKMNGEEEGDNKMTDTFAAAILGAFLTGVCTWVIEIIKRRGDKKAQESHAASILYYDLKSIENYLLHERSSVNLRYTNGWQEMISNCTFLKEEEIAYLFKIYDEVYNYNYHYILKEKEGYAVVKEEITSYRTLQKLFLINVNSEEIKISKDDNDKNYDDIMTELKNHIK